jgi:hypothetical protein
MNNDVQLASVVGFLGAEEWVVTILQIIGKYVYLPMIYIP